MSVGLSRCPIAIRTVNTSPIGLYSLSARPPASVGVDDDELLRIDPPAVADEVPMLRSWLDYYRATVRRQAAGLTPGQLSATLPP